MKSVVCFCMILLLAGEARANEAIEGARLKALEYDNATARYLEHPADVLEYAVKHKRISASIFLIRMATQAAPTALDGRPLSPEMLETLKFSELRFRKGDVSGYVAAIDRFLALTKTGIQPQGPFIQDLAKVPTWGAAGAEVSLKFQFHRYGNRSPLLEISTTSAEMSFDGGEQFYDETNALELKRLLLAFSGGVHVANGIESRDN